MELWQVLITACGSAAVGGFFTVLGQVLQRRAAKKDGKIIETENAIKDLKAGMDALKMAQQLSMLDRIKYLGLHYIQDDAVDFDDRRILNQMHDVYHNKLGGNGDLDVIMAEVNKLRLKDARSKKG